jgi:hypothetical protein
MIGPGLVSVLVRIEFICTRHGDTDRCKTVNNAHRILHRVEHLIETLVAIRGLVEAGAAQFNARALSFHAESSNRA